MKVLHAFLDHPGDEMYGLEVLRATGLKSGTLYPLLDRLDAMGWLASRWETAEAAQSLGPRRRYYRLTAQGAHEARLVLAEHGIRWAWT
jgi:PadR family transcriptional regulator, regulatory protein PadR